MNHLWYVHTFAFQDELLYNFIWLNFSAPSEHMTEKQV